MSDSQIKFHKLPETLTLVEDYKVDVRLDTTWNKPFVVCNVYRLVETGPQNQFWTSFVDGRIYPDGRSRWEYNSTDYVEFDSIESIDKIAKLQKHLYRLAAELLQSATVFPANAKPIANPEDIDVYILTGA